LVVGVIAATITATSTTTTTRAIEAENNNTFIKEQDIVSRLYKTTTSITPSSFEAELYWE
jgi:uncharacterized protein YxeA